VNKKNRLDLFKLVVNRRGGTPTVGGGKKDYGRRGNGGGEKVGGVPVKTLGLKPEVGTGGKDGCELGNG